MLKLFFCAAVLLVFGFLSLPLAIRLHLDRRDTTLYLRLDIAAFCGLIGLGLSKKKAQLALHLVLLGRSLFSISLPSGREKSRRSPSPAPTEKEPSASRDPFALIRWLWGPGMDLLAALPRILALKRVHVRGRFGLGDPARTGSVFGYLQSLGFALGRRLRIDLQPDFTRSGFQGQLDLVVHLHLGLFLLLVLRFALRVAGRWLVARLHGRIWKPGLA